MSAQPRAWVVRAITLVVVAALTVVAFRLIGEIDWDAVADAFGYLAWWHIPVLLALLLVRQTLNSLPLALYIAGLSPTRAVLNDQVGVLIGTMVPPPSDVIVRTAMFSSWRIPIAQGVAGTLLHKLTFYIVRYGTPILGLAILLGRGDDLGLGLFDLISIAASMGILVVLLLVMHSTAWAASLGRRCGRLVRRVRRSVDPEAWAVSWSDFHDTMAARFHRGFPYALAALAGMVLVSSAMVIACMRFVGIDSVPWLVIFAAYLVAFPLTVFPFNGIGLLDAAVVGAVVSYGGHDLEAPALAAMIVWRVFVLGGPMLMGALSLAIWNHTWGAEVGLWQLVRRREAE